MFLLLYFIVFYCILVVEEAVGATVTGVAAVVAVDSVTGARSGMTFAAHMSEVIVVMAVERTEAGLREGKL